MNTLLTQFLLFLGVFVSSYFTFPTTENIYANLASDEIFTPDQYAFNVSCCFNH
ncbi:hypothetical protein IIV25_010L [Invertebrate iridovirus 25]|uniref:Uncharacterized protein n=1 Tax=Invertebrate iridovirus 25 TaxID=1301280 RepID=W8W1G8_9VIRU|nr:hypothetical protein IIV25_010L [Invertebrate iridovirus 25]CCV02028.1 hypothetical protein IIV25_010L [Invertebrate iridovirus 25]